MNKFESYQVDTNVLYHYEIDGKTFITPSIQLAIKRAKGKFEMHVDGKLTKIIEFESDE